MIVMIFYSGRGQQSFFKPHWGSVTISVEVIGNCIFGWLMMG